MNPKPKNDLEYESRKQMFVHVLWSYAVPISHMIKVNLPGTDANYGIPIP
jgi:hypothetical protein